MGLVAGAAGSSLGAGNHLHQPLDVGFVVVSVCCQTQFAGSGAAGDAGFEQLLFGEGVK